MTKGITFKTLIEQCPFVCQDTTLFLLLFRYHPKTQAVWFLFSLSLLLYQLQKPTPRFFTLFRVIVKFIRRDSIMSHLGKTWMESILFLWHRNELLVLNGSRKSNYFSTDVSMSICCSLSRALSIGLFNTSLSSHRGPFTSSFQKDQSNTSMKTNNLVNLEAAELCFPLGRDGVQN